MDTTHLAPVAPGPPAPVPGRPGRARAWTRAIGFVLLAGWLIFLVAAVLGGHRAADFAELREGLADGRVSEVEVVGGGLTDQATGYSVVELRWRDGLVGHRATVVEANPVTAEARRARRDSEASAIVAGPVGDTLTRIEPGVRVSRLELSGSTSMTSWGWRVTSWPVLVFALTWVGTLLLVRHGTGVPRHATRWAWLWLVFFTGPFGALAYFASSGVLRARPPLPSRPWLTGGWAFVLCLVLAGGPAGS